MCRFGQTERESGILTKAQIKEHNEKPGPGAYNDLNSLKNVTKPTINSKVVMKTNTELDPKVLDRLRY